MNRLAIEAIISPDPKAQRADGHFQFFTQLVEIRRLYRYFGHNLLLRLHKNPKLRILDEGIEVFAKDLRSFNKPKLRLPICVLILILQP